MRVLATIFTAISIAGLASGSATAACKDGTSTDTTASISAEKPGIAKDGTKAPLETETMLPARTVRRCLWPTNKAEETRTSLRRSRTPKLSSQASRRPPRSLTIARRMKPTAMRAGLADGA